MRDKYILAPLADRLLDAGIKRSEEVLEKSLGSPVLRTQVQVANGPQTLNNRIKPQGSVSFDTLRSFSVQYDVARMCINRRKRQISGMEWDIVPADPEDKTNYKAQVKELKGVFKNIGGYHVRFRQLVDIMIEDLLVLDALAVYKRPTIGGGLYSLEPIDATTIQLRVDEAGRTPVPPEVAYKQIIRGKVMAELTADELIYEMMNPRTNSPYGLGPLESLILTVSSALKSEMYNLDYLTDGNIPEGLMQTPPDWTPNQIKEFQLMWDAVMAGDARQTSKLKFVPGGTGVGYTATKKPSDMAFEKFNEWLMKKTCAMFEVPPEEIGFTHNSNRATAQSAKKTGVDAGAKPLAQLLNEIFTDIIQQDMGLMNLAFKIMVPEDRDDLTEAQTNEVRIRSGQRTVDEVRKEDGLEAIGVDKPFVIGVPTFIDEKSLAEAAQQKADAAKASAEALKQSNQDNPNQNDAGKNDNTGAGTDDGQATNKSAADKHVELVTELRTFRKYALTRIKEGKQLRPFESSVLPAATVAELNRRVAKCSDTAQARSVFSEYMTDYQVDFLADVADFQKQLAKVR